MAVGAAACADKAAPTAAPAATATADEAKAKELINIRYIDVDSVFNNYVLAQQLMEEQQREVNRLQQWHDSKQRELQSMANQMNQKQQNNVYLTQASMQADLENLQKKSEEAERHFAAQQQRLATSDMQVRARLSDSLTNFVRDYNATRGYDAILMREVGVYFNPELNITAEIIAGLNARFEASNKK